LLVDPNFDPNFAQECWIRRQVSCAQSQLFCSVVVESLRPGYAAADFRDSLTDCTWLAGSSKLLRCGRRKRCSSRLIWSATAWASAVRLEAEARARLLEHVPAKPMTGRFGGALQPSRTEPEVGARVGTIQRAVGLGEPVVVLGEAPNRRPQGNLRPRPVCQRPDGRVDREAPRGDPITY